MFASISAKPASHRSRYVKTYHRVQRSLIAVRAIFAPFNKESQIVTDLLVTKAFTKLISCISQMQILDERGLVSNIKFDFIENSLIGDVGLAGETVAGTRMTDVFKMC